MKKQMFMALVASTVLSSIAMASIPASIHNERIATQTAAIEQGTGADCPKLSTAKREREQLIEPTHLASARSPSKGTRSDNGSGER